MLICIDETGGNFIVTGDFIPNMISNGHEKVGFSALVETYGINLIAPQVSRPISGTCLDLIITNIEENYQSLFMSWAYVAVYWNTEYYTNHLCGLRKICGGSCRYE